MNVLSPERPAYAPQIRSIHFGGRFPLGTSIVALVLVALAMRVWRLDNIPGINGDEAWSGVQAARLAAGESIAWRTPSGNPINVFFLFPLAALHTVFAPSFTLLRLVSVASGAAALVANYLLARRVFDEPTAIVSTLLLAILPIDVAYSRFAWDASQSLLATLLVLYLTLAHYRNGYETASLPLAGMIALAAAVLVHPTNLFAAPLVVVPMAYAWRNAAWNRMREIAVPAKGWVLALLAIGAVATAYLAIAAVSGTTATRSGPEELGAFALNYLHLFSGATVYEYISGVDAAHGALAPLAWLPGVCDWLFAGVVALGAWGMMRRLATGGAASDAVLLVAWAFVILGFFLVAGPGAIAPHLERYGICLVAPSAVVLSRGLAWWIEPRQVHARAAAWLMVAAASLFCATFYLGYFDFIERTGGRSHLTFRTAAVEPKLAAMRYVTAHRADGEPAQIVAGEWWNYWPLAYLAEGEHNVRVTSGQPWQTHSTSEAAGAAKTWYVEFAGGPREAELLKRLRQAGENTRRHVIFDYSGQPVLSVVGPTENLFQNY